MSVHLEPSLGRLPLDLLLGVIHGRVESLSSTPLGYLLNAGRLLLTHSLQPGLLLCQGPDLRLGPGCCLGELLLLCLDGLPLQGVSLGSFLCLRVLPLLGWGFLQCRHLRLLLGDGFRGGQGFASSRTSCAAASACRLL